MPALLERILRRRRPFTPWALVRATVLATAGVPVIFGPPLTFAAAVVNPDTFGPLFGALVVYGLVAAVVTPCVARPGVVRRRWGVLLRVVALTVAFWWLGTIVAALALVPLFQIVGIPVVLGPVVLAIWAVAFDTFWHEGHRADFFDDLVGADRFEALRSPAPHFVASFPLDPDDPDELPVPVAPEARCQVCGDDFAAPRRAVVCRTCQTPHHDDCWGFSGGCSTYGCREQRLRSRHRA